MPRRPAMDISMEDEMASRLALLDPEHMGRQTMLDEALSLVKPEEHHIDTAPPVSLYDDQILELIDAVTLE